MNITSSNNQGTFDTCSVDLSGITANSFTTISISQQIVQTVSPLAFNFVLPTPLQNNDQIHITFSTDFDLTSLSANTVSVASFGTFPLTKISANKIILTAAVTSPTFDANLIFSVPSIGIPFTTASTSIQVSVLTSNNYLRADQIYSYSPLSGTIASSSISCTSQQIGVSTSCSFVLTTISSLASTA